MLHAFEQGCNIVQEAQMIECFLNLPSMNDPGMNPLNYGNLSKQQVEDEKLQQMATKSPYNNVMKTLMVTKCCVM